MLSIGNHAWKGTSMGYYGRETNYASYQVRTKESWTEFINNTPVPGGVRYIADPMFNPVLGLDYTFKPNEQLFPRLNLNIGIAYGEVAIARLAFEFPSVRFDSAYGQEVIGTFGYDLSIGDLLVSVPVVLTIDGKKRKIHPTLNSYYRIDFGFGLKGQFMPNHHDGRELTDQTDFIKESSFVDTIEIKTYTETNWYCLQYTSGFEFSIFRPLIQDNSQLRKRLSLSFYWQGGIYNTLLTMMSHVNYGGVYSIYSTSSRAGGLKMQLSFPLWQRI